MTPFELEILDSVILQLRGFHSKEVSLRATTRILRATLRRIKPPVVGRSVKLVPGDSGEIDHAVPLKVVVDELLKRKKWAKNKLLVFLEEWLARVEITRDEHRVDLEKLGLGCAMPEDWDNIDVFARYRAAGIIWE
ncbi:MAG: hypothetical protein ACOH2B_09150 [Burkholderiaceae bacterium]